MYLEMKAQSFWLNGRPHFFYGGEVHYFRTEPDAWHARLLSLKELGITTVSTYIPWIWHEPEPGQFDFAGQSDARRNLLRFIELADSAGLMVFVRPGPYVMSELRQEGLPGWLLEQHPEIIAQDGEGRPHPTRMVSYLHPQFLDKVSRWYHAVSEALSPYFCQNGGPIVLTQIDNEVGMLHWVSGIGDAQAIRASTLADGKEHFRAWNYGDAEYWQNGVFWRNYRAQYLKQMADEARHGGFPGPYIINVHGFRDFSVYSRGVDYPIGLSQLAHAAQIPGTVLGGDFYPGHVTYDNFHDLTLAVTYTRAANRPDAASLSPEFQSGRFQDRPHVEPSDLDLSARVSIAYGLNGLNWYMLAGGENPENIGLFGKRHDWQAPIAPDGTYRDSAKVVGHLGALIRSFGPQIALSQPVVDLHIGYYSAYYMTENHPEHSPLGLIVQEIIAERETFHFDGIYRILVASNLTVAAVAVDAEGPIDPAEVPYLWMASSRYMDIQTQSRLAEYVINGGTLILGPWLPERDLDGRPARILTERLNLPSPDYGERGQVSILNWDSVYCPLYATFTPSPGAQVLGQLFEGKPEKDAVIIRQTAGQGSVVLMGCGLPAVYDYYRPIVRDLAAALGFAPRLGVSDPATHATLRMGPEGGFLFVHNFDEQARSTSVSVGLDTGALTLDLHIPGRTGLMLPFASAPVLPDYLSVVSTTSEITRGLDNRITIHRTTAAGSAVFKWVGSGQSGTHTLAVEAGRATITTSGSDIDVHWAADENGDIPIIVAVHPNAS